MRLGRGSQYGPGGQCGLLSVQSTFPVGPIGSPSQAPTSTPSTSYSSSLTPSRTPRPSNGVSVSQTPTPPPSQSRGQSASASRSQSASPSALGPRIGTELTSVFPAASDDPATALVVGFEDSGVTATALNVAPRVAWGLAPGAKAFSGEVAFQEAGLYFGNYWSQEIVRLAAWIAGYVGTSSRSRADSAAAAASTHSSSWSSSSWSSSSWSSSLSWSSSSSTDALSGAELAIGVNDVSAAALLKFSVARWPGLSAGANAASVDAALFDWLSMKVSAGSPVALGLYEWVPVADQRSRYDHIG